MRRSGRTRPWQLSALGPSARLVAASSAIWLIACSDDSTRHLDPVSVAMIGDPSFEPVYDDEELVIYEAKTSLRLPVIAPRPAQLASLSSDSSDPFERMPWVRSDQLQVQVSWTLSNLDPGPHNVWVMLDPWNEFGRYEPAVHVSDDEAVRDLSGIDMLFLLPGVEADGAEAAEPRIVGTFTFEDMDELARDFATVFKILNDAVPAGEDEEDPRATLVNHAFNVRDRSYNSPLLRPYQPSVVPGLVGFDFGLRTSEHANIALEIVVEVRDLAGRIAEPDETAPLLEPPAEVISAP
ncbi:MAG TPA: hypothetical protein VJU61_10410 [Polyangiaceae bacterium]|nr:hypothetical protein [Polyangiaceae bacterium]